MDEEPTVQEMPKPIQENKMPVQERREQPMGQMRPNYPPRQRAPRSPEDENTVFVGRKSTMGYVLAVVTQFNSGASKVKIKARGKLISKAVDAAEIARGRFLPNSKIDKINIMTEEVQNEDGSRSKVSAIEICLAK